jgi:glycerol-3-phosphate acyltransferase PlsY
MLELIFILILSYLIGSFPTAIIAGRLLKKIDIRDYGSGNAGATNVFRVLGWKAGIIVLIIDMFKGFAPVFWLVNVISDATNNMEIRVYFQILIGVAAIAGHIWSVFTRFRGGKGVGTAAGVFLGLQPFPVIICLFVFIGIVAKTHYVSLGSITGALLLSLILILEKFILQIDVPWAMLILSILLSVLIVITHRENIHRLIHGQENKISFTKKTEDS